MSNSPPPTREQLDRYAFLFNQSAALKALSARASFPSFEEVELLIDPLLPHHRGGLGTEAANGGILAAIFDFAIGCTPALVDPTRRSATLQLSMSFERPLTGNILRARGKIDRSGSAMLFASAVIYDQSGVPCARCQGVASLSKLPWASGESPAVG